MRKDPGTNHDLSTVDILKQTAYIIMCKDYVKFRPARDFNQQYSSALTGQLLEQFGQWNVNQYFTLTRIWSVVRPLVMKSENIQVNGKPILQVTVQQVRDEAKFCSVGVIVGWPRCDRQVSSSCVMALLSCTK